ncbi:MAG: Cholesterol oxidase [Bacteroidia bacterium]|nr:Cholesterol oxidase [Bacteroidia bacterium]
MDKVYDYIIIGSGFGGSVSAMRLSEKGYSVAVLEKGKKYETKDFPKNNWNIRKYLWMPLLRCFGIQKLSIFKEAFILSGVGVGGGSLVYANTLMQPDDKFYTNKAWAHLKDWKTTLAPYYDKARFMLGVVRNPKFYEADNILREIAKDMGKEHSFEGVNVGVYYGDTKNFTDPYFKGLGPERRGCIECAECMVGCRHHAKNTLDKNYLWFAQKNGAEIIAETFVEKIEFINDTYHVHTVKSTAWVKWKKKIYKSKGIVFSGGVLGTMDLLLKQKYKYKTLEKLSDKLGYNLRTNSESLCGISDADKKMNEGVAITSIFNPDEHTHIEVVKFGEGSNSMKVLATLATGKGSPVVRTFKMLGNVIMHPFTYLKLLFGKNWSTNSIILLVMQTLDNSMRMAYSRLRGIHIKNDGPEKVPAYIESGQNVMHRFAKKVNGTAGNGIFEVMFDLTTTAHIMGGCPMGTSIEEGVVDSEFKAFGYPNMFILDGSIIPCNLGVNPSLTITTLSEYAMSCIPDKQGNKQKKLDELLAQRS